MRWEHRVNPEWLAARKKYLTASDIKRLLPLTPTGKKRANLPEAYMKVWANKHARISEDDVLSTGVMARGHILEPYAIADFNKLEVFPELFHWDDALIHNGQGVSASPDALSILQPLACPFELDKCEAHHHGEVKCYSTEAHYAAAFMDKMQLEERWQIATAFYCAPGLEESALILYHPGAEHPLFWHKYTRAELVAELAMIDDIRQQYEANALTYLAAADVLCSNAVAAACQEEEDIIDRILIERDTDDGLTP